MSGVGCDGRIGHKENDDDGRNEDNDRFRSRRFRQRGNQYLPLKGYGQETPGDDRRGQAARRVHRRRGRPRHPPLGDGPRRHALHALVPADDGLHGGEARCLPGDQGRRADHAVFGQEPHRGRAGRLVVPFGRHPFHLRGARLHGMGPDEPRVHQAPLERRDLMHSDGLLCLHGRVAGQKDSPSPFHAGARQVAQAPDDPLWTA